MRLSLLKRKNNLLRRIARACLGPLAFAWESGYSRSCLKGFAVDSGGQPIPMYTYPMIDLLRQNADYFATKDVLEFGSGQSTRWWARQAGSVTAVEYNEDFAGSLQAELDDFETVRLIIGDDYQRLEGTYDVICIDGYPRVDAASFALKRLATDGIIIVDNSDVQSLSEIAGTLREAGFARVDLTGYSPGAFYKQCTSLFFREPTFLTWSNRTPAVSRHSSTEVLR